jgi:hypothetical protein
MDTAAFNLKEIARKCLVRGVFPILATIIPRRDNIWYTNFYRNRIYYLNEQIRQLTAELTIPLVEQFTVFNEYPEEQGGCLSLLSEDLKHPSEKGYQLMAQTWFDGIQITPVPPLNLAAALEFVPDPTYKISWEANPHNYSPLIRGYNIYKKEASDSTWQLILSVSPTTTSASFTYSVVKPAIEFGITAVGKWELESEMALFSIIYPALYPPDNLHVAISTKHLRGIPEMTYKLSWNANPQNNAKFIRGYKIYKKEGSGDYVPLESLPSTALSATYTYVNPPQRILFALATVSVLNTESPLTPFWTR